MGLAFYVVAEHAVGAFEPNVVDGKALAHVPEAALDARCRELGVRPLMEFFSQDPEFVARLIADAGGDPAGVDIPAEQWFDSGEGLATVQALLSVPEALPGDVAAVTEDLRGCERLLALLATEGVRWHLSAEF